MEVVRYIDGGEKDFPRLIVRDKSDLITLDSGEFCAVCHTTENITAIGLPTSADEQPPMAFAYCPSCEGEPFRRWLAAEFERALAASPEQWQKNSDGTWRELK